ncbi:MAG TPA: head maturation protease, ClpP-related, partial [Pirellulales bacterium]|nr:head maturation protease, ClpP-related [Pirellulales bacterium]
MKTEIDKYYRIVAQDKGDEPTAYDLMLFAALGEPLSEASIWAKSFAEELAKLPKSTRRLNIHINSPGGSVAEAQAIYSTLADHPSEKIVYVDGLAASAATIPMCVGHKVFIRKNANMMIHLPTAFAIGNADAMRDAISMLESVTEGIVSVYEKKTGKPRDELRALMQAETWMTADEAVAHGFCDETRGVIKAAASLGNGRVIFDGREFDLVPFKYKKTPIFSEQEKGAKMAKNPKNQSVEENIDEIESNIDEIESRLDALEGSSDKKNKTKNMAMAPPTEAPKPAPPPTEPRPEPIERPGEPKETESYEAGVLAERTRLAELELVTDPACAELVAAARADGRTRAEIAVACLELIQAEREQAQGYQQHRRADAS